MEDKNSVKKEDENFNEKSTCENKQIIIDGVDVSKCEFSLDCIGIICELKNGRTDKCSCSDYPHCYFKQLARKTQEYNDLLEQHKELDDRANRMIEEKYNLSIECVELKGNLRATLRKYKKVLEKIEEVVKEMHSICIEEISITASQLNDRIYRESCERFKQIFNIINKAKGE